MNENYIKYFSYVISCIHFIILKANRDQRRDAEK